ncbi:MAG: S8 family serine peptidase, partial [Eubacteriales bacterium]|nr:S8 family serine peptidase [Eubacteriales bacterium]
RRSSDLTSSEVPVVNPEAGSMSSFSSWGTTSMLTFNPVLTGVGGYVYAADGNTTDGYVTMSGTSMANPNVAGSFAVLLQYLKEGYVDLIITKTERAERAIALLTSSTTVLYDEYGIPYSPRQQGTGLVNAYNAFIADHCVYIADPVIELGDDPEKIGFYTMTFTLVNNSIEILNYELSGCLLTPDLTENPYITGQTLSSSVYEYDLVSAGLASFNTDYTDNIVIMDPLSSVEITVTFELNQAGIDYLNQCPYGTYLEGYINADCLTYPTNAVHASFLGFYGDWGDAPCIEGLDFGDYCDLVAFATENGYGDYLESYDAIELYELLTMYDLGAPVGYSECYSYSSNYESLIDYLGNNPFEAYYHNDARNAISNAESDSFYYADAFVAYPTLVRNSACVIMVVYNPETDEVYYVDNTSMVQKNYLDTSTGRYSQNSSFTWNGTDSEGNLLPHDTVAEVAFFSWLDWENDDFISLIPGDCEDVYSYMIGSENIINEYCEWSFPVTIDSESPAISYIWDAETEKLTVEVTDNQYIALFAVYDEDGNEIDFQTYDDASAGAVHTYEYDLSAYEGGIIYLDAMDYATNMPEIAVYLTGGNQSNIPCEVTYDTEAPAYTITPYSDGAYYSCDYYFYLDINEGYAPAEEFEVSFTGSADSIEYIDAYDIYVITNVVGDITIGVTGIKDIGLPYVTFTYGEGGSLDIDGEFGFNTITNKEIDVTINAFDDEGAVAEVYYYCSTQYVSVEYLMGLSNDYWTEYTGTIGFMYNNTYAIHVKVVDDAGNIAYINSDGLIIDKEAPVIEANGVGCDIEELINNNKAVIAIDISDRYSDVGAVSYTINGGEAVTVNDLRFSIMVSDIPEGECDIVITASDIWENTDSLTLHILKDTVAPAIIGVEEGDTFNGYITVNVETEDLFAVLLNGKPVIPDENGNIVLAPAEGEQTLKAMDVNGNFVTINFTVNPIIVKTEDGEPMLNIQDGYILLDAGINANDLLAMFETQGFITEGDYNGLAVTGTTFTIDQTIFTVIVDGDVNGDGLCSVLDYITIRLHLLGIIEVDDVHSLAAASAESGELTVIDYINLRLKLLGIQN